MIQWELTPQNIEFQSRRLDYIKPIKRHNAEIDGYDDPSSEEYDPKKKDKQKKGRHVKKHGYLQTSKRSNTSNTTKRGPNKYEKMPNIPAQEHKVYKVGENFDEEDINPQQMRMSDLDDF